VFHGLCGNPIKQCVSMPAFLLQNASHGYNVRRTVFVLALFSTSTLVSGLVDANGDADGLVTVWIDAAVSILVWLLTLVLFLMVCARPIRHLRSTLCRRPLSCKLTSFLACACVCSPPQGPTRVTALLRRGKLVQASLSIIFSSSFCLLIYASSPDTSGLVCILAITLVSNGGALPSAYAFVTSCVILVFGLVDVALQNPDAQLFFIVCAFVFVVIAASGTQYYQRRRSCPLPVVPPQCGYVSSPSARWLLCWFCGACSLFTGLLCKSLPMRRLTNQTPSCTRCFRALLLCSLERWVVLAILVVTLSFAR
jgi:hypothetical protein